MNFSWNQLHQLENIISNSATNLDLGNISCDRCISPQLHYVVICQCSKKVCCKCFRADELCAHCNTNLRNSTVVQRSIDFFEILPSHICYIQQKDDLEPFNQNFHLNHENWRQIKLLENIIESIHYDNLSRTVVTFYLIKIFECHQVLPNEVDVLMKKIQCTSKFIDNVHLADWNVIEIPEKKKLSYNIRKFVDNCMKVKNIKKHEEKYKKLIAVSKVFVVFLVMASFIISWYMAD